ncbi:DNA-3-methyladenine glycosylase [Mesobacillus subterraneus]|uniref:Putative 3-methyladenine DNA glycosylase n=1 Tax=Mesobacillus subterraneus TaxID=285983 RepID=A0A427TYB4_9BACI|nr:DNA-3-methyladenine glycosylase [Mesobacillus subterraneus]RSD29190.1 DNA-3-methyladenine glycosylase [Mesobacillus subterraneus]
MEDQSYFFPILDKYFFQQPTLELAVSLLGCVLIKECDEGTAAGMIVETEAYIGPMDRAAHSYNNRRTRRTEVMFHEPGLAYTYVMHTHTLFNVVSGEKGNPEAVLVRAVEPVKGIELMARRRGMPDSANLTNGPGKLTKALGIKMSDYGHSLTEKPLYIAKGMMPDSISSGKRIGIDNSGEAKDYPWRFWITDNPYVSRHQKAVNVITQRIGRQK